MTEFRRPTLDDKAWISGLIPKDNENAEICFTNIYLWQDNIDLCAAETCGRLVVRAGKDGRCSYSFPTGDGDLRGAVDELKAAASERGEKLMLHGIPAKRLPELEAIYGGEFTAVPDRNNFDYVYSAKSLAEPSGKKLHSKKNHINRFIAENDWTYEALTEASLGDCRRIAEDWLSENDRKLGMSVLDEASALNRMFEDYASLGLEGGILRVSGRAVAFTVGEPLNEKMFVTHFEKAYADINGAYPMINRCFARQILELHPEIEYINREEDMGMENLRRAKESYCPEFMVEKFTAKWR